MFNLKRFGIVGAAAAGVVGVASFAVPALAGDTISNDMARCAAGRGSAVLVTVTGLKEVRGRVRVQSYPATRAAWLERGRWLTRIEVPARAGAMQFCVPIAAAGSYGIAVRHDLDGNGGSGWNDGGGFSNNPGLSLLNLKPSASRAAFTVGEGVTRINIVMNYRQGTRIGPIRSN